MNKFRYIFVCSSLLLLSSHEASAAGFNNTLDLKGSPPSLVDDQLSRVKPEQGDIDLGNQKQDFQDASSAMMVMTKEEISVFRETLREYSASLMYRADLVKRSRLVSIDAKSPIFCAPGFVSTVNFVDALGTPWPIEYILPSNQSIILAGKVDGYTIMMSSLKMAGETNLVVKLKDIDLPLNFYVHASDETLDSTLVIQMHGQSPDSTVSSRIISSGIPSIKSDAFLMEQFLADVAPMSAVERVVDRRGIRAWSHDGHMYLRTTYILASPMAMDDQGTVTDGRGTYVYRLSKDVSRLNMLIDGKYFSVKVNINE